MGRHKKVQKEILQPRKALSDKGVVDWVSDVDEYSKILSLGIDNYFSIYGLQRVYTSEIENMEVYDRLYDSGSLYHPRVVPVELGGKQLALKPELCASLLRMYIENKIFEKQPFTKWGQIDAVFSHDAKGKIQKEMQLAVEVFGSFNHMAEVLILSGLWFLLQDLGLKDISLEINNLGDTQCQMMYAAHLKEFLSNRRFDLCDNCSESWNDKTLDVLRCENIDCQAIVAESPMIFDFLDPVINKSFTSTLEALDELGIPYQLNHLYVGKSGLDRTVFVIRDKSTANAHSAGTVLCSGGYHEEYLRILGGKNLFGFGFEASLSKILEVMEKQNAVSEIRKKFEVFLVPLGELAAKKCLRLFRQLISADITVFNHFGTEGVKNQLKAAELHRSPVALIMGQKEAQDEVVILRDVKSGMQEMFHYDKIVEEVFKRLGK